jgi:parvulin-like peptidyl-prolyl isomerase
MENGEFSERRYRQTASSERFTIRNATRDNLLYEKYLGDLFSIRTSSEEAAFFKTMASPERKFRYVNFAFTEFPDSGVAAYGKENPEKFARMKLSLITITTGKSDAEKVREQAAAKNSGFEDLAKTHSKDAFAEKGGDMGWRYFYELDGFAKSSEDIRGIFALKPGEISAVVEGPDGYRIFRCDEAAVGPDFAAAEVLKIVRDYMTGFERGKIEDYILNQAREFKAAAEAGSFTSVAGARGKPAAETDFFPINYGNSVFLKPVTRANDALAGAAFRDAFFSAAFALPAGAVSEPIVLRDNVVVLQLVEERSANENEMAFLDAYYPLIVQQFQEENLQQFIMNTKDLKDNFNSVFMQYFIPQEK